MDQTFGLDIYITVLCPAWSAYIYLDITMRLSVKEEAAQPTLFQSPAHYSLMPLIHVKTTALVSDTALEISHTRDWL